MTKAWVVYLAGFTLFALATDYGWPKWLPPTTAHGVYAFAFGGLALMFLGSLLLLKIL